MIQFIAAAAMLAGRGIGAFGSYQQGRYSQRTFRERARVYEMEAAAAERASEYESSQIQIEGRRMRARQLVQYAKSGILPEGTPKLVIADTKQRAEKDAALAIERGQTEAAKLRAMARIERQMGKAAHRAGVWSGISGMLSAGSQFAQAGVDAGWWGGGSRAGVGAGPTTGMQTSYGG